MTDCYTMDGSKLRICSFWLLFSCRGNTTSNFMTKLPLAPGLLLMGMPSPLKQQQSARDC